MARYIAPGTPEAAALEMSKEAAASTSDVVAEAARRIQAGHVFTVAGYGDIALSGDQKSITYLGASLALAERQDRLGDETPIPVLDASRKRHLLTPAQTVDLVTQGFAWVAATEGVATDMIANGIPADYSDDEHWNI